MGTLITTRCMIVEQLPLFLQLRRRKWKEFQIYLDEGHLSRPAFFLLRALEEETAKGLALTLQQMQNNLFNPYATRFTISNYLPPLIEQGYIQQRDDGYIVTEMGHTFSNQIEITARSYLSRLHLPSSLSLQTLAETLVALVHRSWQAPEPLIKAHQARTQRRLSVEGAPTIVQIEWAILGLWEARDDAHIAAWRAYQFSGPVFDILSRIWNKEAQTILSLISTLEAVQHPTDIQQGILELVESGYIIDTGEHLKLTPQGQKIRDTIDDETDRIFFAPWDQTTDEEVIWLNAQISELCAYFRELA